MSVSAKRLVTPLAAMLVAASACGNEPGDGASAGGGELRILASFYPLQWIAEQVGGETASVDVLTTPGVEPHDLELTPGDIVDVGEADLVVFLSGFQPSVDEAVEQQAADSAFDAADSADLTLTYTPIEEGREVAEKGDSVDPHFWLDPLRLADVADELAARLAELSAPDADAFTSAAESLREDLEALDAELQASLARCTNRNLVTSHNAFGYLAERYDLTQVGITGLTPDDEPSPADLATAADFVQDNGVRTIYYETLISPATAEAVAEETGARTAVLDPLEGLTDESDGADYLEVMRSNLASLQAGQPCP